METTVEQRESPVVDINRSDHLAKRPPSTLTNATAVPGETGGLSGNDSAEEISSPSDLYEQFADAVIRTGKLRESELNRARRFASQSDGEPLSGLLVRLGLVSERDVAELLVEISGYPAVNAEQAGGDQSPLEATIPLRFLEQNRVVGLYQEGERVAIAMADPLDDYVIHAIRLACGKEVIPHVGIPSEIERTLEHQFGGGKSGMDQAVDDLAGEEVDEDDIEHLKDLASEAPVIRMVNLIFQRALESRASDIHIEPFEELLKVRLRVDGVLRESEAPPARSTAAVISRIKIMARLNIAERRLPQDGRIKVKVLGKELDMRVSTVPTMYGESLVIRLLDKENIVLDFDTLGFTGDALQRFLKILERPHGILLITGPTGSGKSTTLYTALNQLNDSARKIITVEDPVEYQLVGINQIQAKSEIGLTFASALRSIMRQDPDIIMIGEMRDLETARIGVQSALTGHLVLSTLHTNDAAGGITRLLDMGLEDYLLTSTVNGILAQRLVRKLCNHCKQPYQPTSEMIAELHLDRYTPQGSTIQLHQAVGCDQCGGIGFYGRMAIVEFLVMSNAIRRLVMDHAEVTAIVKAAQAEGMGSLYEDGMAKALAGLTTIEDVMRVTSED